MKTLPAEKRCSGCKRTLPMTGFYKNKRSSDGYGFYCKTCHYRKMETSKEKNRAKGLPAEKRCTGCGEVVPLEGWHLNRKSYDGLQCRCKKCQSVANSRDYRKKKEAKPEWYERLLEKGRKRQLDYRLKLHGIDLATYEALKEKGCAICGGASSGRGRYHADHDHKTGKFRGLLCSNCNAGLGHFQDNPAWLIRAAEYLRQHAEA